MAIIGPAVARILKSYVVILDGMIFLPKINGDNVMADLNRNHQGIYSNVVENSG